MKMVFFSAEYSEIEPLKAEFMQAGIPCEIRHGPQAEPALPQGSCAELWILNDHDFHRALLLCVELGAGFARRPPQKPEFKFEWEI
jgi:hypothetical protein